MDEVKDDLKSYRNLGAFFYRELKPGVRVIDEKRDLVREFFFVYKGTSTRYWLYSLTKFFDFLLAIAVPSPYSTRYLQLTEEYWHSAR